MLKEYKLVNINLLQISIAHGPGDASLYPTETHVGLSFLMYYGPTILKGYDRAIITTGLPLEYKPTYMTAMSFIVASLYATLFLFGFLI